MNSPDLERLLEEAATEARRELPEITNHIKRADCLTTGLSDWDSGGGAEVFLTDLKCRVLIDRNDLITLRQLGNGEKFRAGDYRTDADRLSPCADRDEAEL